MVYMRNRLVKVFITAIATATLATSFTTTTEAATKVYLNKKSVTLTEGKAITLKVKGISSKTTVKWSTSNKRVATVKKGKITAKKKGTAVVSAKFTYKKSGKKVTKTLKCKVNVKAKRVQATKTPKPTSTPRPTATPTVKPTNTVAPTATPKVEPTATSIPAPTATPEVVQATATPTPTEVAPTEVPVVTAVPTEAPIEVAPTEAPVHVHDYNARYEVVKESTCTEDGLINLYCECGEVYQRVICAKHLHVTFSQETCLLPTETSEGYFGLHCEDCGEDITFSERTTFPALTDENYPLEGWVYEKHDYDYNSLYYMSTGKVDKRHEKPYIVVTDYIGTAEHPALKGKYVIDGVEYDVVTQGEIKCSSPTVQSIRFCNVCHENPSFELLQNKKVWTSTMGGVTILD